MDYLFQEKTAEKELEKGLDAAEKILADKDKMAAFFQRLEKKLEVVPLVGDKLAAVPIMASLLRSYIKKDYTDIPLGTILAITSALIYFVSPIGIIPDTIPFIGYLDDAAVIAACWKLVESDVLEYTKWREEKERRQENDFLS